MLPEYTRTVQLVVDSDGDQGAIAAVLNERYEVIVSDRLQSVDCHLISDRMLSKHEETIRDIKTAAHPTFQPVLLLQREQSAGDRWLTVGDDTDGPPLVDEVVAAPIDRVTLYHRLDNLLARRSQSVELSQQYTNVQSRFERLFDATNDAIFVVDIVVEEITECNPSACALVGCERSELLSLPPAAIFSTEIPDGLARFFQTVRQQGDGWTDEFSCQRSDGERRQLELSATTVDSINESILIVSARDITERKAYQQQLELRTQAMEGAPIGISITDPETPDNQIRYVNSHFEELTGYSREYAIGRNCRFLQGKDTREQPVAKMRAAIENNRPVSVTLKNYRKDGTPFWNQVTIAPVRDDGTVTNYIGFQEDVSSRKLREQQLSVLNRIIRHNIRNGMNVIKGNVDILSDRVAPDHQQFVDPIEARADALSTLSHKAGTVRTLFEQELSSDSSYDVREVISKATTRFDENHPDATLSVGTVAAVSVFADDRLEFALSELLDNAVVHNDKPTAEVTISVETTGRNESSEWVDITISDNGPGIPDHERTVIETGEETSLQHGNGLGLWLVYWTVSMFNGKMRIADQQVGTRVTLRLPRVSGSC